VEPKSPRMSLILDALENNRLSPSLRRGAREGDFRDLCILTSHGRRRLLVMRFSILVAFRLSTEQVAKHEQFRHGLLATIRS
jgi:hypothetical protein